MDKSFITSVIKNWKFQKGNRDRWKNLQNKKGLLGWQCKPQIPILTDSVCTAFYPDHFACSSICIGVKIGICGLHYHPSDPFLFCSFFQRSLFPFWNFQFLITLVHSFFKIHYGLCTKLGPDRSSRFKLINFLNVFLYKKSQYYLTHKFVAHRAVQSQHFTEKTSFNAIANHSLLLKILNGHDYRDKMGICGLYYHPDL